MSSHSSYDFDPLHFSSKNKKMDSMTIKAKKYNQYDLVQPKDDFFVGHSLFFRILAFFFRSLLKLTILGAVFLLALFFISDYLISDLPDPKSLSDPRETVSIKIQSQAGHDIGLRGSYFAGKVTLEDVSPHLANAILAVEDRKFYSHFGFDPVGILRAMFKNMRSGRVVQGASTLTQQLAKDLFLTSERSYIRKFKELLYAIKIESTYNKKKIFELYLNRVYLGSGLYGVKAAAERYFSKHPRDLNIQESALIAGLLKAPSRYSPTHNPIKAQERARTAIHAMYHAGYITEQDRDMALSTPINFKMPSLGGGFGYVADRVAALVPKLIGHGHTDVIVTTTINENLQAVSDAAINDYVGNIGVKKGFSQAAFIALDDRGAVLAMTGGKSYSETSFNRTMQAYRQPGSAFKSFVFAAAFEKGYRPDDIIIDEDVSFGQYRPMNYKKKYEGPVSLRTAFAKSINTVAVKLAHRTDIRKVAEIARRAGIVSEMKNYLSLSLGAFEVTPLELTSAYIPFFNNGYTVSPHLITHIHDKDGNMLFALDGQMKDKIFSAKTVAYMKDIFNAVTVYGTGKAARLKHIPTYGKTGTTSSYKDAWFIGHAGNDNGITAGVWAGNDNFSATNEATGGQVAGTLWKNIMSSYFLIEPRKKQEKFIAYVPPKEKFIQSPHITIGTAGKKTPVIEKIIQQDIAAHETLKEKEKPLEPTFSTLETEAKKEKVKKSIYDDNRIENLLKRLE